MPTRNERDDELRAKYAGHLPLIGGGANPGGMLPDSDQGQQPIPIVHVKSKNPIAGPMVVTISQGGSLAQLGYYTTPDNVPRKATVFVAPSRLIEGAGNFTTNNRDGVYAKITTGSDRGSVSRWVGTPCIMPVEGEFVKVEATIGSCPFLLQSGSAAVAAGTQGQPTAAIDTTHVWQSTVTAVIIDGWTEDWPSSLLVQQQACQTAPLLYGPVIIDKITLSNFGSNDVAIAFLDSDGLIPLNANQMITSCIVPAGVTDSVVGLTGPIGTALRIFGFTGNPSSPLTHDTNDADVFVSIWGKYLGTP